MFSWPEPGRGTPHDPPLLPRPPHRLWSNRSGDVGRVQAPSGNGTGLWAPGGQRERPGLELGNARLGQGNAGLSREFERGCAMNVWQFMSDSPWLSFFLACLVIDTAFRCWNRLLRVMTMRKLGYPPPHCDADGDFKEGN